MVKKYLNYIFIGAYFLFIAGSFVFEIEPGKKIGNDFFLFLINMLKILPCAFILIGLFEVWVKKETVEKHFVAVKVIKPKASRAKSSEMFVLAMNLKSAA